MEFVRNFTRIDKGDIILAGGKGASLGEMTKAGMPVPPGFVVLSTAFENFLEKTDLNIEIDSILHTVSYEEIHTVEDASEKIQALILNSKMPQNIEEEIQKFFKNLASKYVAVRSSATVEDSASAAWAGQLESYLNTTEDNLLENIKRCWASLFTPRAIFYRFERELHRQKISVAVVVQKMIQSESSGIAFSVHPVTQDYNQIIIEAGFGLGEAIVSGQITPDSYVVEKEPRRIMDKNIQIQTRGLFHSEVSGNEWKDIPKELGEKQVLSDKEIMELSETVLRIEKYYGFPCDIEWALEDGRFYILQSRPITTLTPKAGLTRKFKKFFTRELALITMEYWYAGEYEALKNILGGATRFNPLFIRKASGLTDVYYDINNPDTALQPLFDFFINNPEKFKKEAKRFEENHQKLLALAKEPKKTDIKEFFNVMVEFWGFLPVIVQFGTVSSQNAPDFMINESSRLRKLTQGDEYAVGESFLEAIKVQYPHLKEYGDVVSIKEIVKNTVPAEEILIRRKVGFIYFEGQIIIGLNMKEFEGANNIKLDESLGIIGNLKEILADAEANKKLACGGYEVKKNESEGAGIVRGSVAYPGLVRGRVRIIMSKDKIGTVQEGEVLVTAMTTPEFMPALKKAAAFITDEGGITSHAAIVSRELKKPCIIGTKTATQILKDGDLVEVNANTGVVKIIK